MGEVYRATDTRLKRDVAIKVLPEDVTRDRERLARFEREAQVLASLSHPNIGAIFGVEDSGGTRCLILELIEGETLSEMIQRGPMPVEGALRIALQIAEGLEAAHDKGIVHRDLKPANVKVTPDGTVKVLDFGLAKAQNEATSQRSDLASLSPTMTAAATQMGVILGTAGYMSPEQAAGQQTDRRSDVWSFGVVMLEMLTGRKTFAGETVSHTLASVLKEEPDWSRLPSDLPPRVRALLERCLSKKVRRRLQSIGEARVLLEEYRDAPESFSAVAQPRAITAAAAGVPLWRRAAPWALAAVLGLALATVPLWMGSDGATAPPLRRVDLTLPSGDFLFRGYGSSIEMSPDGSRIAYVTSKDGQRMLHVQYLDQWSGSVLVEGPDSTTGPYHPFFSPDGQWIGFVTRTELKKVPVRGGSPITLCVVDRSRGASWGEDGSIVVSTSPVSGLFRVPAAGGELQPLTQLDEKKGETSHRWPQVLPGGDGVLFTSVTGRDDFDEGTLEVLDLASQQRKVVLKGGSYGRYVSSGHIIYYNKGTIFALPFDLASLEATGSSIPAVEEVSGSRSEGGAYYSVSNDGTLAYTTGNTLNSSLLVWVEQDGRESPLWSLSQNYQALALSPDGTALVAEIETEGNVDLWTYDLKRDVASRLTFGDEDDSSPVWSPDGRWIYYASQHEGLSDIYRKQADGSGEEELILKRGTNISPNSISPDGRNLAFLEFVKGVGDIMLFPLDGGGEPRPFANGPGFEYGAQYSPDGRWIIYGSNESGAFESYVRPASGERGKWQISRDAGVYPTWSRDGKAIFYRLPDGSFNKVPVESDATSFRPGRVEKLFGGPYPSLADGAARYSPSSDGRFVVVKRGNESTETHEHIRVVLSWLEELKKSFAPGGSAP